MILGSASWDIHLKWLTSSIGNYGGGSKKQKILSVWCCTVRAIWVPAKLRLKINNEGFAWTHERAEKIIFIVAVSCSQTDLNGLTDLLTRGVCAPHTLFGLFWKRTSSCKGCLRTKSSCSEPPMKCPLNKSEKNDHDIVMDMMATDEIVWPLQWVGQSKRAFGWAQFVILFVAGHAETFQAFS